MTTVLVTRNLQGVAWLIGFESSHQGDPPEEIVLHARALLRTRRDQ